MAGFSASANWGIIRTHVGGQETRATARLGDTATAPILCAPMPDDIAASLQSWPFETGRIVVRLIDGDDGRRKLQIRLHLGMLQLELTGRPDGQRPHGFDSLLDYQRDRQRRYETDGGSAAGFVLSSDECKALREEAVMFYHRYVGFFVLEEYDAVIRDTTSNLDLLDLLRDFAAEEQDRTALEQFRPHILMMRARAAATAAIQQKSPRTAMTALDTGIREIRAALAEAGLGPDAENSNELQLLHGMREALVPRLPMSQRVELEERLAAAIAAENFELAAILRDELRMMRE